MQQIQQAEAQCVGDLCAVQKQLEGLCTKIVAPMSDSRASHDVCVGGLLGMESPQGMFWGSKPKFWPNLVVKLRELRMQDAEVW